MNKTLTLGFSLIIGLVPIKSLLAAPKAAAKQCPVDIATADVVLSKAFPHFTIDTKNPDDFSDDVYLKCSDLNLTQCQSIPLGPLPAIGEGLVIIGSKGFNYIKGSRNDDIICGLGGNDFIKSGKGNDTVYGGNGNDVIIGGKGNDILYGGNGKDSLYGLDENHENFDVTDPGDLFPDDADQLFGGNGKDYLAGGPQNDVLRGENGKDYLNGGEGLDDIDGGKGNDSCFDEDDKSHQDGSGAGIDECLASESAD